VLVGRGEWVNLDLLNKRLDGWQILNGSDDADFARGLNQWMPPYAKE